MSFCLSPLSYIGILYWFEIFVTLFISLFGLEISVSIMIFDVIFSEKMLIDKSLDFLWIFVFI